MTKGSLDGVHAYTAVTQEGMHWVQEALERCTVLGKRPTPWVALYI
jgi:hypothetical protein